MWSSRAPSTRSFGRRSLLPRDSPPSADWFDGATWETTPSEQYAEATVEVVLGRRTHHGGIVVSDEAVTVVRQWGSRS